MSGDTNRRFCDECQLHVHNLSAMSRRERERFVIESEGKACVAYELRPDGTMVTPSFWRRFLKPLLRLQFSVCAVLAALLPFFFSACASRRTLGRVAPSGHTLPNGGYIENSRSVTVGVPMPPEPREKKIAK
jgi:hypothetical protein